MSNVRKLAAVQTSRSAGPSEESAAEVFKDKYGDRFRFDQDRSAWFEWTGSHWQIENTGLVLDLIRETVKKLAGADDDKARRSAGRFAFASGVEKYCRVNRAFAVECALDGGQFQAAVLTGCWACRSSYCAGLR
jgi:hypothetical protein